MTRALAEAPLPERPRRFFYGRVIAATSFGATFASVVFFNPTLGVFSSSLEAQFGWTRADVALAITFGSAGAAIASPAIGWAIARAAWPPWLRSPRRAAARTRSPRSS